VRIRVILVSVFTAILVSTLFVTPAQAQDYGGGTFTIDDPTLAAGDAVGVTGTGCAAAAEVTLAVDGEPIGTTTADGDGAFAYTGTLPAGTAPGPHTLTATCGDLVQSVQVTVSGDATGAAGAGAPPSDPPPPGGALPRTGTDVGSLLRWAAALLLAGVGLVLLARNRHAARRLA
jgi:LPXTG-motif cell wall-anchored protein